MRAPIVDGEALPEGYGILFEQTEHPLAAMLHNTSYYESDIRTLVSLHVWITKQNWKGEYVKYREVTGSKSVLMWDDNGHEWEYTNGYLKVTKSDIDLEKEYEDDGGE